MILIHTKKQIYYLLFKLFFVENYWFMTTGLITYENTEGYYSPKDQLFCIVVLILTNAYCILLHFNQLFFFMGFYFC